MDLQRINDKYIGIRSDIKPKESPCLYALDKDQKAHRVELVIIEEK